MKLFINGITFSFVFLFFQNVSAQDTILVYDVDNKTSSSHAPVAVPQNSNFEKTSSFTGLLSGTTLLNDQIPVSNVFANSQFTKLVRAADHFDLTTYPIRTTVNLRGFYNDTFKTKCTGTLIAKDYVLTAAHCIYSLTGRTWVDDSLQILPGFNNGNTDLPFTYAKKYFMFKSFYDQKKWDDIALIQLREPIGDSMGWIGIGYNSDSVFFTNNVFHKFSYPATIATWDSTLKYNGDTMYYNYGIVNANDPARLMVKSPEALGVPGQSGSSLIYTDNNGIAYSLGVLNFSIDFVHYRIDRNIFYQFKNILDGLSSGIQKPGNITSVKLYPNPFTRSSFLEFENESDIKYHLEIYDCFGKQHRSINNIENGRVEIQREDLSPGIYIYQIRNADQVLYSGKLVIQ